MSALRMKFFVLMAALAMTSSPSAQTISVSAPVSSLDGSAASTASKSSSSNTGDDITVASPANATSQVVSVWRQDDDCSTTTQRSGCLFDAICDICLSRTGCAIESTTGKCVSISRINPANVGVEYFWKGMAEYCDASDDACSVCASATSDAPCYGASGCVCLRQCQLQSTMPLTCGATMSFTKIAYIFLVIMIFGSLSLCVHIRRARINNALADRLGIRRLVLRRPRPAREPHPLALKLDNWKKDRLDHSEEFTDIELKSCFVQIEDGDSAAAMSQRETMATNSTRSSGFGSELGCLEHNGNAHGVQTGSETTITVHVRHDGDVA